MKKILRINLLFVFLLTLSLQILANPLGQGDVDLQTINNRMKRANFLDRDLRRDKRTYLKGQSEPFTGTLELKVGDYIEYTEVYQDGLLQGDKTWYDEKGNIMMIETYERGKLNGEQITYYPSAKVRSVVKYRQGVISGVEWHDRDGDLLFKEAYDNGTGRWVNYYDNGQLYEEGQFLGGARNGEWRIYDMKGNLVEKRIYRKGQIASQLWM